VKSSPIYHACSSMRPSLKSWRQQLNSSVSTSDPLERTSFLSSTFQAAATVEGLLTASLLNGYSNTMSPHYSVVSPGDVTGAWPGQRVAALSAAYERKLMGTSGAPLPTCCPSRPLSHCDKADHLLNGVSRTRLLVWRVVVPLNDLVDATWHAVNIAEADRFKHRCLHARSQCIGPFHVRDSHSTMQANGLLAHRVPHTW
jgi:hypothetical protein